MQPGILVLHRFVDSEVGSLLLQELFRRWYLRTMPTEIDRLYKHQSYGEFPSAIYNELSRWTHLLLVVGESTDEPWWEPFTLGVAMGTDMPTALYMTSERQLPEYMDRLPRLRSVDQLEHFAGAVRSSVDVERRLRVQHFEDHLRTALDG